MEWQGWKQEAQLQSWSTQEMIGTFFYKLGLLKRNAYFLVASLDHNIPE